MKSTIAELLKSASEIENKAERIKFIRENDTIALRYVVQLTFQYKWRLPKGCPDFEPNDYDDWNALHRNSRYLKYVVEHENNNVPALKAQEHFLNLIEQLNQDEVDLLVYVKDNGKMPFKRLTKGFFSSALEGVFDE